MTVVREPDDDPSGDARVFAAFEADAPRSSAAHDAEVLAAADRVAATIRSRHSRARWRIPAAIAASLALAGVWSVLVRPTSAPPPDDELRGAPAVNDITPAANAVLRAPPTELKWRPVSGVTSYRVSLRDATGRVIASAEAHTANAIPLDRLTTAPLAAGSYFWSVRARGPVVDRELGPYAFSLEPDR